MMRIAEEANLYGVRVKTICSDGFQLMVKGVDVDSFHVQAVYGTRIGLWKVIKCCIRINRDQYVLGEDGSDAKARKGNAELPGGLEDLDHTYLDPSPLGESVAGVFDGIEGIADDYGDDKKKEISDLADSPKTSKKVRVKSPIKAKWLLPIVHSSMLIGQTFHTRKYTSCSRFVLLCNVIYSDFLSLLSDKSFCAAVEIVSVFICAVFEW
jgi:hypothetical protein